MQDKKNKRKWRHNTWAIGNQLFILYHRLKERYCINNKRYILDHYHCDDICPRSQSLWWLLWKCVCGLINVLYVYCAFSEPKWVALNFDVWEKYYLIYLISTWNWKWGIAMSGTHCGERLNLFPNCTPARMSHIEHSHNLSFTHALRYV